MPTIVFQHKETKRYLAQLLPKGRFETVKTIRDAISWDIKDQVRKSNLRRYLEKNGEILQQLGFEQITVD